MKRAKPDQIMSLNESIEQSRALSDLSLACRCGTVRGIVHGVSPESGNRVVCYCRYCQRFPEELGCADEVLDAHGGTEVFQTSPARLEITEGLEQLACLRLTRNGVFRWYTACCNTPIGNTLPTSKIPFVGLIHSFFRPGERSLEEVLGPVRARVNGKSAKGDRNDIDAHDAVPLSVLLRVYWKLLVWRLRGDHKRSPFFDSLGAPVAKPQRLYERGS